MKTLRYVNLDPTGNLTCLVLDPPEPSEEPAVTRYLMGECEQVAYLEPATDPEARIRVFESREDAYRALYNGAVDGVADDEAIIRAILRSGSGSA